MTAKSVLSREGDTEHEAPEIFPANWSETKRQADRLIAQLADSDFDIREKATEALFELYPLAVVHIEKALLKATDAEVENRLAHVAHRPYQGLWRLRWVYREPLTVRRVKKLCSFAAPGVRITYTHDPEVLVIFCAVEKERRSLRALLTLLGIGSDTQRVLEEPAEREDGIRKERSGKGSTGMEAPPIQEALTFIESDTGFAAYHLSRGFPQSVSAEKLTELSAVVAPKARVAYDAGTGFLLIASDESEDLQSVKTLVKVLGVDPEARLLKELVEQNAALRAKFEPKVQSPQTSGKTAIEQVQPQEDLDASAEKLNGYLAQFDTALLEGDRSKARQVADAAARNEALKDDYAALVKAMLDVLRAFDQVSEAEEAALQRLVGQPFKVGDHIGKVRRVQGQDLYVEVVLGGGKVTAIRKVKLAEIDAKRRAELVQVDLPATPAGRVAGAITKLHPEAPDLATAAKLLAEATRFPLAPHYLELHRIRLVVKTEVLAEEVFTGLEVLAGRPCGTPEEGKALLTLLDAYLQHHGKTQFTASKKVIIEEWRAKAIGSDRATTRTERELAPP